jgi:hypothetical protein
MLQRVIDFIERRHELRPMEKVKSVTRLKRLPKRAVNPEMLPALKRFDFHNSFNFLTLLVICH